MADSITITGGEVPPSKGGDVTFNSGEGIEIDISIIMERVKESLLNSGKYHNITISSGVGVKGSPDGSIYFCVGSREMLRIGSDGKFYREGKEIGQDFEILVVLRAFLGYCSGSINRY